MKEESVAWDLLNRACIHIISVIHIVSHTSYHVSYAWYSGPLEFVTNANKNQQMTQVHSFYGCVIFHCIYAQFSSVAQSCPTLCSPMDCSTPGLPVHHQLPEFTQTHVRWVGDAIQPSHPPLSHSPPAFNLSQHQGLFKWVSSSH